MKDISVTAIVNVPSAPLELNKTTKWRTKTTNTTTTTTWNSIKFGLLAVKCFLRRHTRSFK
jgi:hypothetical protein